ncbi:MAG: HPr family phosphocarrier protein [Lachnospiraceae bacterium]
MNTIERKIKLRPDEAKAFVLAASKCDFDIDIFYNRYIVDAKSMLGVLGLDFAKTLSVRYCGYDADFENYLRTFAFAC